MELGQLAARVLRRWPTVLVTTVVITGLLVAITLVWPRHYTSEASVAVAPIASASPEGSSKNVDMPTEIATASSRVVATRAAEKLEASGHANGLSNGDLVASLLAATEVSSPSQSSVLRIASTANSPEQAAEQANALAQSYLEDREATARQRAESHAQSLKESIAQLGAQDPSRQTLRRSLAELESSSPWPGRVISTAVAASAPAGPGTSTALVAGLIGGLMLGCAAALIREARDPRIRFPDRLEAHSGVSSLDARGGDTQHTAELVAEAVEARYGVGSQGALAVLATEKAAARGLGEQLAPLLPGWRVESLPLPRTSAERSEIVQRHDAVTVAVTALDELESTSHTLEVLDRGRAGVLAVVGSPRARHGGDRS